LWNITKARETLSTANSVNASLSISYSNVDWDFLKVIYGWAAVQYQAWVRGEIVVGGNDVQHVIVHTDSILECWIDDKHYFGGDYYSYRNAPPVLHLTPGPHIIDLRLVRDVRAFGGILEPTIDVVVDVRQVAGSLELAKPGILISDFIDGRPASSIGSVHLRNSGQEDIEVLGIRRPIASSQNFLTQSVMTAQTLLGGEAHTTERRNPVSSDNYHQFPVTIVAGQTKPVAFNVFLATNNAFTVEYDIIYRTVGNTLTSTLRASQSIRHVDRYAPHKFTFLHNGGMVSYAMLRPPAKNATCRFDRRKLPILLQFHGAGVEADNPMVYGALDSVPDLCAWILFPTGVTSWSGDDWHNWGFADVEAAIAAIPDWIESNVWHGPDVDTDRWIVSGHSNGGQGTWFALTHRPDKVLAAAPVSGYTSIQKYVPYEFWQSADPRRKETISASLNSYRHEILMPNAQGIPIQQQHGGADDNVPAYHSRLLAQQLYLENAKSSYNEAVGFGHWWEGVMTTPQLVSFYYNQTNSEETMPRKLKQFNIIVGDPGDMGSKSGIRVKHLEDPGRYGRVSVRGHTIKTSNVQDLEFDIAFWKEPVIIDKQKVELSRTSDAGEAPISVYKSADGWRLGSNGKEIMHLQRNGRQLGSMTAILRTKGAFIIRHSNSTGASHIALQISRSLHQYFKADTQILSSGSHTTPSGSSGNVITLGIGSSLQPSQSSFPVKVDGFGVIIRDYRGREHRYGKAASGAAFLRPLQDERLELVIWGSDEAGLQQAARIVPLLTGVGQPDFVVLGESAKWKGIEGALAMGFFDSNWEVTPSSVIDSELDTYEAND
jgi:poly(3-hydroxybutyrate) depolymerase